MTIEFSDYYITSDTDLSVDAGFLNLNYQSTIEINHSRISNSRGVLASFLYATGYSNVSITNGTIIKNSYSESGNTIHLVLFDHINVTDSFFQNNS